MKQRRKLKVYGFNGRNYKEAPTIRIKGKWLEECGFGLGVQYSVECEEGRLILSVIDETEAKA